MYQRFYLHSRTVKAYVIRTCKGTKSEIPLVMFAAFNRSNISSSVNRKLKQSIQYFLNIFLHYYETLRRKCTINHV